MALIDVTDVLFDPDFADSSLKVERSTLTIGDDGIARKEFKTVRFTGVVTPDTGDTLIRGADGERVKGRITIHTKYELRDSAAGGSADIVQWRGLRYTVTNVSNNMNFGKGFVRASCDVIPLTGV